ncbi:MAG: rhomboid family intramembrane serine protease [Verrucomicrobiota bacterium JB023]|nr:rhomboid family intramembrane serine protease [Verrucomicrobiota bacterium JB023]
MEGSSSVARSNIAVIAIMVGLVLVHVAQFLSDNFLVHFSTFPNRIAVAWEWVTSGDYSFSRLSVFITLLTGPLLHADPIHLGGNLFFFWIFAALIRELLGSRWMMAIVALTAVAGAMGDVAMRWGSPVPSLGISGAVMGLEGAYLGLAVRWRLPDPFVWPMSHPVAPLNLAILAGVGFFLDISGVYGGHTGTAFGAHLGGFIVGLFLTSFVAPRPRLLR